MEPVYMDHHATTPVHPQVLARMLPYFVDLFGNPSSTHASGRRAAEAVEEARAAVAAAIGASATEIVFTSGATEANNLALRGIVAGARERGNPAHVITSVIEHKSILDTVADLEHAGTQVTFLQVGPDGRVDPDDVSRALRPETCLVSIQAANSEIGALQPLAEIAARCAAAGVPLHTDAAQAVGRIPVQVGEGGAQLLSLSGHKIYGPKGTGALYLSRRVRLRAQMTGGGHERGRRSGTLNVPGIVGLGAALELAIREMPAESTRLAGLRDHLWARIRARIPRVQLNGHPTLRLPNNLNVSFTHVGGEALLMAVRDFALSSGSACTSGSTQGSYVVRALGGGDEAAHSSLRFGLGRGNTEEQVDRLVEQLAVAVERLRAISTAPGAPEMARGKGGAGDGV
jgi:cysteine desulfurase